MSAEGRTHRQARAEALAVLAEVDSLLPEDMDATLRVESYDHEIQVQMHGEDVQAGQVLADLLGLTPLELVETSENVHHNWKGKFREHTVKIIVLTKIQTTQDETDGAES